MSAASTTTWEQVGDVVRHHCGTDPQRHAYPGAVLAVAVSGQTVALDAMGNTSLAPDSAPMTTDAVFDVASVTKPVVTATALLQLVDTGVVSLADPLDRYFPRLSQSPFGAATLAQLLTHTSGLPWIGFQGEGTNWDEWLDAIAGTPAIAAPGTRVHYSCTGFILLGRIIEQVTGQNLGDVARRRIFEPLGMTDSRFLPLNQPMAAELQSRLIGTESRRASGRGQALASAMSGREELAGAWAARHGADVARGVVHDENAAWMGGVAGNAGLFSTASDLLSFGVSYLDGARTGARLTLAERSDQDPPARRLLSGPALRAAIRDWTPGDAVHRGLGWQISGQGGDLCDLASPQAFGHTGFTGTMLVADPECDAVVVLLTNRLCFGRANQHILRVRRLFLNAVFATVSADL